MVAEAQRHLLVENPVRPLDEAQLARFTSEALRIKQAALFNPWGFLKNIHQLEGKRAIVADFGGAKLSITTVQMRGGQLEVVPTEQNGFNTIVQKEGDGANYFKMLDGIAAYAWQEDLPIGISTAGSVKGTTLEWSENLAGFVKLLRSEAHGDFAKYFQGIQVFVANDAVAGCMAGTVQAIDHNNRILNVIYGINGGGIGAAVFKNGVIYANEPGHIPVTSGLNPFLVKTPCDVEGAQHVCIERVGSGAGIEAAYSLFCEDEGLVVGREISLRYQQGWQLPAGLYENSAKIMAHALIGVERANGQLLSNGKSLRQTAVVLHGGVMNVPGYPERVMQILDGHLQNGMPMTILTKNMIGTGNACGDGATIGAFNLLIA